MRALTSSFAGKGRAGEMASIFWDTMLFICSFEDHPAYADRVVGLRKRMLERGDRLFTGALAVGEILLKPAETGDHEMLERYHGAFHSRDYGNPVRSASRGMLGPHPCRPDDRASRRDPSRVCGIAQYQYVHHQRQAVAGQEHSRERFHRQSGNCAAIGSRRSPACEGRHRGLAFCRLLRRGKPANAGDSPKAQGEAERRSVARRVAEPWETSE
jgi:hypothetical protein